MMSTHYSVKNSITISFLFKLFNNKTSDIDLTKFGQMQILHHNYYVFITRINFQACCRMYAYNEKSAIKPISIMYSGT